jgi:hypothetical protein
VTYRDEAGALLGRCGAPYSFRRWGAAAQAAFNALVAELNPFAPRRSTLILSPALGGKAGRNPCGCLDHQLLAQARYVGGADRPLGSTANRRRI